VSATAGPLLAVVELRARLMLRRLRGTGGTVELVARVVTWALAVPAAFVFAALAGLASYRALRSSGGLFVDAAVVGLFFGVWQAWTAIALSIADREAVDLRRFLVYPIRPARVWGFGIVASLVGDPFALFWSLLLAGAFAGAAFARPGAWLLVFALTLLLFVVATVLLVSLLEEVFARLARRRGLRVLGIGAAYVALGLVVWGASGGTRVFFESFRLAARFRWILWPPAFASAATRRLYAGDVAGALPWLAALAAGAVLTGVVAYRLALRAARSGGDGMARAAASARGGWRLERLPGRLGPLLEKEVKYLARHPLSGVLALIVTGLGAFVGTKMTPAAAAAEEGGALVRALPLFGFAVYAHLVSQVFWLNSFGWDRGGARLGFLAPVSPAETLAAKNAAAYALSLALFLAGSVLAVAVGGAPPLWACAGAVLLHAGLAPWLFAPGNVVSILSPRAMRLTLQRGARLPAISTLAGLLVVSVAMALFAAPVPIALLFDRPAILLAAWAGLGGAGLVVYGAALRPTGRLLARRREALLDVVGGDEA
jgi:ABC-2 type transport system permease protein